MSYARLGCDGSNVYVYTDYLDGLTCCFCAAEGSGIVKTRNLTTDEMIEHLRQHEEIGDGVPPDIYDELEADRAENDALALRARR